MIVRRILALAVALAPFSAHAQGLTAVRPIPGVQYMALRNPDAPLPPVYAQPSASSQRIGIASNTMIAPAPLQTMNGYVAVLHLDGRPGWLEASKMARWHSASNPAARCTPSVMSDGRPGFNFGGS